MRRCSMGWILIGIGSGLAALAIAAFIFIISGFFYYETLIDEYEDGTVAKRKVRRFFTIPEEKCALVERFKKYHRTMAAGGPYWRIPIVERVRVVLPLYEQEIDLFDEQDTIIDFKDGAAKPVGAKAFIKIRDPRKAFYNVRNWRSAIKSQTESVLRSYFNGLTLDEALAKRQAGFDIAFQIDQRREEIDRQIGLLESRKRFREDLKEDLLRTKRTLEEAYSEIENTRRSWGVQLKQIFLRDLELSPETVRAREDAYREEREARAARYKTEQRVWEIGQVIAGIRAEFIAKGYSPDVATSEASKAWQYWRGTEKGSVIHILGEEGSLAPLVAAIASAWEGTKGRFGDRKGAE